MMSQEEWKIVKSHDMYSISNFGRIMRTKVTCNGTEIRILRGSLTNGYPAIYMYKDGIPSFKYIHQLVTEYFIGPKPHGLVTNHKDGNKLNNNFTNLEYVTYSENNFHAYDAKLKIGNGRKLTEEIVREIIILKPSMTYKALAKKFSVGIGTIVQIFDGRTWKHVMKEFQ